MLRQACTWALQYQWRNGSRSEDQPSGLLHQYPWQEMVVVIMIIIAEWIEEAYIPQKHLLILQISASGMYPCPFVL